MSPLLLVYRQSRCNSTGPLEKAPQRIVSCRSIEFTRRNIYIYYYFQVNHTQDVLSVLLLKVKLCHEKRQEEKAH